MNWTKEIPTVDGWYWVMCSYTMDKFIELIEGDPTGMML